jgi:hypothetical protein
MNEEWVFHGSCVDGGPYAINGVELWTSAWIDTPEEVHVKDPLYQQDFCFPVYELKSGPTQIRFAAGEFSNCIWGFFVQRSHAGIPGCQS